MSAERWNNNDGSESVIDACHRAMWVISEWLYGTADVDVYCDELSGDPQQLARRGQQLLDDNG